MKNNNEQTLLKTLTKPLIIAVSVTVLLLGSAYIITLTKNHIRFNLNKSDPTLVQNRKGEIIKLIDQINDLEKEALSEDADQSLIYGKIKHLKLRLKNEMSSVDHSLLGEIGTEAKDKLDEK